MADASCAPCDLTEDGEDAARWEVVDECCDYYDDDGALADDIEDVEAACQSPPPDAGPDAPAVSPSAAATPSSPSSQLAAWLAHKGLSEHAPLLCGAGLTLEVLPWLTEADTLALGLSTLDARRRLLRAAHELVAGKRRVAEEGTKATKEEAWSSPTTLVSVALDSSPAQWSSPAVPVPSTLFPIFCRQGVKRPLRASAVETQRSPRAWHEGESNSIEVSVPARLSPPPRPRPASAKPSRAAIPLRPWQLVPGCPLFAVDRFDALPQCPQRHWFLTHFHADHYKGLGPRFAQGRVYCSAPTARLAELQLRVPRAALEVLPWRTRVEIAGAGVTLVDANHCPGAAMLIFDPPGTAQEAELSPLSEQTRRVGRPGAPCSRLPPVLHTGDCRLEAWVYRSEPLLQRLRHRRCRLVLDTTYADPRYDFPPQREVVAFCVRAALAEASAGATLFLFGTYTIGKERVFLEVARALGRRVCVAGYKKRVLDCLDLPEEDQALLTTDPEETDVHAVPMRCLSREHMRRMLRESRGRFASCVAFRPTGWTFQKKKQTEEKKTGGIVGALSRAWQGALGRGGGRSDASSASRPPQALASPPKTPAFAGEGCRRASNSAEGKLVSYSVPYSEHSSFSELRAFVQWLDPLIVTPAVNADVGGPKSAKLVRLLRGVDE